MQDLHFYRRRYRPEFDIATQILGHARLGKLGFCGTNLLAFSVGVRRKVLLPKSLSGVNVGSQKWWLGLFSCLVFAVSMQAQQVTPADEATRRLALDIFKQLIEINTTDSVGTLLCACMDGTNISRCC